MLLPLLRLRPFLPRALFGLLLDFYWELYWKREGRRAQKEGLPSSGNLRFSERAVLAERLAEYYPFESLLEVGCSYGQNFFVLAPLFPDVSMCGLDPNPERIEAGRAEISRAGLESVELKVMARGEGLGAMGDKSFDVVVTCACLLEVGRDEIEKLVGDMIRVSKRALLLVEQHEEKPYFSEQDKGSFVPHPMGAGGYWVRDYNMLFRRFVSEEMISVTKIPNPHWMQEQWQELGVLVEVDLQAD